MTKKFAELLWRWKLLPSARQKQQRPCPSWSIFNTTPTPYPLSLRSRIRSYLLDQVSNHTQPESPPRIPNKTTYIAVPQILVIHNTFVFPKYDTLLRPVAPRLSTICLLAAVYKFRILSLSLFPSWWNASRRVGRLIFPWHSSNTHNAPHCILNPSHVL